jgi:hypothetical protein
MVPIIDMYAGTSSSRSEKTAIEFCTDNNMSVASAYEHLLLATTACSSEATKQHEVECVRSGTAVYPVMEAAQYILTVLVGRYIGILSKEVLLTCLAQVHAYVRI